MESEEDLGIVQVRRLPTLHFEEDEYFIDNRLREFRMVTPPIWMIDSISFDSTKGRQMLEHCVWLTCSECGRTFEVARRSTIDKTWCTQCRRMVVIPELFRASDRPATDHANPSW